MIKISAEISVTLWATSLLSNRNNIYSLARHLLIVIIETVATETVTY
jgi:hypothetical protein